jgi:hypothetical protein
MQKSDFVFKHVTEYMTVEVSIPSHSRIDQVIDAFKAFLIAVQFNADLVKEHLGD